MAVANVHNREVGALSTRSFSTRLRSSEDLILRLDAFREFGKHRGSCVSTVSFNAGGDILASGSHFGKVTIWDWESGNAKLSFLSGYGGKRILQANFIPYSEDRSIVTCAADGQVRHAQILEGGRVESKLLTKHKGRVHKLAIEPGSPHILYSCGTDGLVQHLDLRRTQVATDLFTCRPIFNNTWTNVNRLYAIAIDPRNPNLFAVAGADSYARLYDIRKYNWNGSSEVDQLVDSFCPAHLSKCVGNAITGLAFSDQSELLVSYAGKSIYLFSKDMGRGPHPASPSTTLCSSMDSTGMSVAKVPIVFKGHINVETVRGVNFVGPRCDYVMSGSDCGRIFIWKKKSGELIRVMEADTDVVHCVGAHPHITALASSASGIKIWTPIAAERAVLPTNIDKDFVDRIVKIIVDEDYRA